MGSEVGLSTACTPSRARELSGRVVLGPGQNVVAWADPSCLGLYGLGSLFFPFLSSLLLYFKFNMIYSYFNVQFRKNNIFYRE